MAQTIRTSCTNFAHLKLKLLEISRKFLWVRTFVQTSFNIKQYMNQKPKKCGYKAFVL